MNEHASYRNPSVRVCVRSPLIELALLNVQYSSFRLMVELIFITLLCLLRVHVCAVLCVCVCAPDGAHALQSKCPTVCLCVLRYSSLSLLSAFSEVRCAS